MYKKYSVIFASALILAGCATSYGSSGITGGYSESRLNHRLMKVNFSGNGYITSEKIQMYALYRCAELARDAKKPYFVVYDSLTAAARNTPSKQPRVGTLGGKPTAFAFVAFEDEPRTGTQETADVLTKLEAMVQSDVKMQTEKGAE